MSATGAQEAPICPPPPVDLNQLLQYFILKSVFSEEAANLDAVIDALISQQISEQIVNQLLANIPEEFRDVVCTMKSLDAIKMLRAAMRGEAHESNLDKLIELAMTLQLLGGFQPSAGGTIA